MKTVFIVALLVLVAVTVTGCAAGPNTFVNTPDESGRIAGFWQGLWHGVIAPVTFVISLFADKVHVYEVHNSGAWYNFGFLLGLAVIWGGGGRGTAACKR